MIARALLAAALFAAGCAGAPRGGTFDADAFHPRRDLYRVRYGRGRAVLGPGWRIENFARIDGEPRARTGRGWETVYRLPVRARRVAVLAELYDLRFRHERGAVLWARTLPIDPREASSASRALLERIVARIAGGRRAAAMLAGRDLPGRVGWQVIEEGPATIDGRRAYFARLSITTDRAAERALATALVAFVRTPRPWLARVDRGAAFGGLAVFALVSPTNVTDPRLEAEFRGFVGRVDLAPGR